MFLRINKSFLRAKSRIYLKLALITGFFAVPFILGCNGQSSEERRKQIDDSIAAENHKRDSLLQAKKDSTALAEKLQAKRDSLAKAKADSAKKAQQLLFPPRKYGVPVNPNKPKPGNIVTKYGVPSNTGNKW